MSDIKEKREADARDFAAELSEHLFDTAVAMNRVAAKTYGAPMNIPDEQFHDDERDHQAQQQADNEAREYRLTEILRRLVERVMITPEEVIILCRECGIDKRNVF